MACEPLGYERHRHRTEEITRGLNLTITFILRFTIYDHSDKMKDSKLLFTFIATTIVVAVFLAGCTTPTPVPSVSPSPTVPAAISPAPTPVVKNDAATISFAYITRTYSQSYLSLPVGPGELIYAFDVTVDSDKPVYTDGSWFTIEYRQNSTAEPRPTSR